MGDDKEPAEEVAETEAVVTPEVETQGETPEVETPEVKPAEAETEPVATEPERVTRAEAEEIAAKAVADLQRRYDEKLQANAHNAKLADVLDKLKDHLEGRKPVDPDALPDGFEHLPESLQKHLLTQNATVRELKEQQKLSARQEAEREELLVQSDIHDVVMKFRNDPKNGKLFKEVEAAIADDMTKNKHIHEWVRSEPEEAIPLLFEKHAKGRVAIETAKAAAAKATASVKASSRPSTVSHNAPTVVPNTSEIDAFDAAWAIHGEKVLQEQGAE